MNCFECANTNDAVAAVGVCRHCSVGLCLDHLVEAATYRVGGTVFGCRHQLPHMKPPLRVPAGIATAERHSTTGIA